MEQEELKKPSFDIEIKAEIKGVAKIENNINQVKEIALAMKEYYSQIEFENEEEITLAVEEKKKVNDFKKEVSKYRIDLVKEYKKPIDLFEQTAKETEAILTEVYEGMNKPVNNYRDKQKQKTIVQLKEYFEEYTKSKNIDFLKYEDANINVTLNTTITKGKKEIVAFVDKVEEDLKLIDTQENKEEILVEYKQSLNVSNSIMVVTDRKRRLEEERNAQAELQRIREAEQKVVEKVVEVVQAPKVVEVPKVVEEQVTLTFAVTSTESKLRELIAYMNEGGYKVEQR